MGAMPPAASGLSMLVVFTLSPPQGLVVSLPVTLVNALDMGTPLNATGPCPRLICHCRKPFAIAAPLISQLCLQTR